VMTRWGTTMSWKEALQLPASGQMQYLRELIESRPMLKHVPDQSLIVGTNSPRAATRIEAIRGKDGSYAFVYLPSGQTNVVIQTGKLSGRKLAACWFIPRTGEAEHREVFDKTDMHQFTTPKDAGPDWVLVLDDLSKHYSMPGKEQR